MRKHAESKEPDYEFHQTHHPGSATSAVTRVFAQQEPAITEPPCVSMRTRD
ncbi:MAG: hypothetical protein ACLPWF_04495 [Bryobacteraceae bacterium]